MMTMDRDIVEAYSRMPQVIEGDAVLVTTERGTECVPSEVVQGSIELSRYTNGDNIFDVRERTGVWMVRTNPPFQQTWASTWVVCESEYMAREMVVGFLEVGA